MASHQPIDVQLGKSMLYSKVEGVFFLLMQ